MKQHRDSIDFAKENIPRLFLRLFIPTLLGLLFGAMLNIADGIFLGQGVGSDALAAVNVAAPIFLIGTGTALLFGSGVSVVVAIHLSHGNYKAANIMLLRSCILLIPAFLLLPPLVGNDGLWLAVPMSELITAMALLAALGLTKRSRSHGKV